MKAESLIPWESWIDRENIKTNFVDTSSFDRLCELAVSTYGLDSTNRKQDLKDRMHFFIIWWNNNLDKMRIYRNYSALGMLLKKRDHSIVSYYLTRRVKSLNFEYNTLDIKDFLES
tara:strand:- start:4 stop:351 length:348 start_codon:yes stop_codon:yes gene_type:complete